MVLKVWELFIVLIRGGINTRPDPDTSDNRCAKPGPRYPTRLSTKVLISMLSDYYILNVSFSLRAQSLCDEPVMRISAQSIAWLPVDIFFTKITVNIEEFGQSASG